MARKTRHRSRGTVLQEIGTLLPRDRQDKWVIKGRFVEVGENELAKPLKLLALLKTKTRGAFSRISRSSSQQRGKERSHISKGLLLICK